MSDGVRVERALLFQAPNTLAGWQDQMILAIATAKRLGYTNLEIDTNVRLAKRDKPTPPPAQGGYLILGWSHQLIEGDEWKTGTGAAEKIVVEEVLVKVWATRVVGP